MWDDMQMRAPQGASLLWQGYREPTGWVALIWSALGPGALAAYLQTQVCTLHPTSIMIAENMSSWWQALQPWL